MTESHNPERRRYPRSRKVVQIEVRAEGSDVPVRTETSDICETGCYIQMSITLEMNSRVSVTLWLGYEKVKAQGRVVTRHPQFGNGIELEMHATDQERLRKYLES